MAGKDTLLAKIVSAFPFMEQAGRDVVEQFLRHASISSIPKGQIVFMEGDECNQLALILSGAVRVYKPADSGREITLYRLGAGESCILTASCIYSKDSFPAVAIAEEDIEAAVVPSHILREWIDQYDVWRNYIFNLLSRRLSEVMSTLEEVAFRRVDIRIAELLVKLYEIKKTDLKITHHDIAMELGSSREVVSRILKHFEYEHIILLKRGIIVILNIDLLRKKAGHARQ